MVDQSIGVMLDLSEMDGYSLVGHTLKAVIAAGVGARAEANSSP